MLLSPVSRCSFRLALLAAPSPLTHWWFRSLVLSWDIWIHFPICPRWPCIVLHFFSSLRMTTPMKDWKRCILWDLTEKTIAQVFLRSKSLAKFYEPSIFDRSHLQWLSWWVNWEFPIRNQSKGLSADACTEWEHNERISLEKSGENMTLHNLPFESYWHVSLVVRTVKKLHLFESDEPSDSCLELLLRHRVQNGDARWRRIILLHARSLLAHRWLIKIKFEAMMIVVGSKRDGIALWFRKWFVNFPEFMSWWGLKPISMSSTAYKQAPWYRQEWSTRLEEWKKKTRNWGMYESSVEFLVRVDSAVWKANQLFPSCTSDCCNLQRKA